MTYMFSGKTSFNKLFLLIGVPLKSIQVKEWNNKKNVIYRKIYEKQKQLNFILKVSTKDIKVGRTQIWGYLEFIYYIIAWNIRKLKNLKCFFCVHLDLQF